MQTRFLLLFTLNVACALFCTSARAQTSAFTYQGQLNDDGNPASGLYDLAFTLYDAATDGTALGSLTNTVTDVSDGVFAVTLDFGLDAFDGAGRWLEIAVTTNGTSLFSKLSPRQLITSVPYAMYANTAQSAATANTATNLVGGTDDADADPANELNTGLGLAGGILEVTDPGGTLTVDLTPLADDNDWAYLSGSGLTGQIYHSGDVIVDNDYLEVRGNANEKAYLGGDGAGNDVQIGSLNSNVTTVATWNPVTATRMSFIASNLTAVGHVGIGTASPVATLDVRGTNVSIGDAFMPAANNVRNILNLQVGIETNGFANGISFEENSSGYGMGLGYDGSLSGTENKIVIYDSADTERFVFENGGNLGIGTSNPSSELEVLGTAKATAFVGDGSQLTGVGLLATTVLDVNATGGTSFGTSFVKVGDIGSFTKLGSTSTIKITFEGRIGVSSVAGTGAVFELRVDNTASPLGRARALIRSGEVGFEGVNASITGIFTGLATGSHTISVWVRGAGGTGTGANVAGGNFATDHVVIMQFN